MKPARVKGLDPAASLADNAARIITARANELEQLAEAAIATDDDEALHDTRIAAKRLRYVLDTIGFCFGDYAGKASGHARKIQDLLGEIHDCDVLLPRVVEQIAALRTADALAVADFATGRDDDLEWRDLGGAPNRSAYVGLEKLALLLAARRADRYLQFLDLWSVMQRDGFQRRLTKALKEVAT